MKHTYEHVIRSAISDFETFFTSVSNFKVNFELRNINLPAKIVGGTDGSVLLFDKFSAGNEIESLDDVMLILVIIGHELAHYVNKHNSHIDETKDDSISIEGWADYFGARVTFALITYGPNISKLIANLTAVPFAKPASFAWRQSLILGAMSRALLRAYEALYKPGDASGRYLKSDLRIYNFLAGVTSFFYRDSGELNEDLLLYVYKRLVFDNKLAEMVYDPREGFVCQDYFDRIRNIHVGIQGDGKKFITAGLKIEYWNLMGTSYIDDPAQRMRSKERISKQFQKWSFKVGI
jgi:hypothetical protein